jgi:hypothetical protein
MQPLASGESNMKNTRSRPAIVRLDQIGPLARKAVKLAQQERRILLATGMIGPEDPSQTTGIYDPTDPFAQPGTISE